jgi:predicted esterase
MRNCLLLLFAVTLSVMGMESCNRVDNVVNASYVCPVNRFITEQFTSITSTISYGTAKDYAGRTVTLQANIAQPTSDTLSHRPLIIYCHGGGFTGGSRADTWANKFCQSFARRGYVVASIDYRLGLPSVNDASVISAHIRAVQDLKNAVRYFKQTAIEIGNPYRIDTTQIFIAGESTGAMIALQAGYLKSAADFADIADINLLTGLNGINGPSPIAYSAKVAGVISLSGALLDLNWLTNSTVPVISVHSSNDGTIPYKTAVANPYVSLNVYGDFSVDSASANAKFSSSLYTFKNAGTAPYLTRTKYADSTINYVSQKLFGLVDCQSLGHR